MSLHAEASTLVLAPVLYVVEAGEEIRPRGTYATGPRHGTLRRCLRRRNSHGESDERCSVQFNSPSSTAAQGRLMARYPVRRQRAIELLPPIGDARGSSCRLGAGGDPGRGTRNPGCMWAPSAASWPGLGDTEVPVRACAAVKTGLHADLDNGERRYPDPASFLLMGSANQRVWQIDQEVWRAARSRACPPEDMR